MRSKNMQVLTRNIKEKRPDATIYGIGDEKHKRRVSGHNEDDTPGVRAEDQDSDNVREHRAIDVMINSSFSRNDGNRLVDDLTSDSANRNRLIYINWGSQQWHRRNNWQPVDNSDDPHPDHVHISGEADDDDNESNWNLSDWDGSSGSGELEIDGKLGPKTIAKWQQVMGTKVDGKISDDSQLVRAVQQKLKDTVDHRLVVDGEGIRQDGKRYKTVGALQRYLGVPVDQIISTPVSRTVKALQRRLNENRF